MDVSLPPSRPAGSRSSAILDCESNFHRLRDLPDNVSAEVGRLRWPAVAHLHLDFHTSPAIPDVATRFDAEQFADRLCRAGIDSVTLFAKCHHSMCYYPTRVATPHPGLAVPADGEVLDLLGQQIEACHARDIRCPVYVAVGWSEADAEARPDWRVYDRDGRPVYSADADPDVMKDAANQRPHVAWSYLDVGDGSEASYGHHVLQLIEELCDSYPLDGLFLDICTPMANFGPAGTEREADVLQMTAAARQRWLAWAWRVERVLRASHPGASLFFNGLAEADTPGDFLAMQSHLEIEDLPSFWGGYDRFPIRVRCLAGRAEASGKSLVAMSGRFHTMWGEFGGYKHPDALRMEAIMMVANGCRCSFGDQLPPSGVLDEESLTRLTPAMLAARSLETYVDGARFVSSLAICREPRSERGPQPDDPMGAAQGIGQALLEMHREFGVVSPEDLGDAAATCRTIIVGEAIAGRAAAHRISAFARQGGRVLLVGGGAIESAVDYGVDCGVSPAQRETCEVDYITVGTGLASLAEVGGLDVSRGPVLCYHPCMPFEAHAAEVLAEVRDPYFRRTVGRFCSHRHSPPNPESPAWPAVTVNAVGRGQVYCLGHGWGEMYRQWGMRLHRDLLGLVLRHADPAPTVEASLPSAARVSLLRQDHLARHVLHVVYAPPLKRGCVEVLEDFPGLSESEVVLNLGHVPRRAWNASEPERPVMVEDLGDGRVRAKVPAFTGHTMIVFED